MALLAAFIEFGKHLPTAHELREQLLTITGVGITVEQDETGYFISSSDIKSICAVDIDKNIVMVELPQSSYLEWACVVAFIRLGGRYDYSVPKIYTWYSYSYFTRILLKRGLWAAADA
jgi:hypothetical protein